MKYTYDDIDLKSLDDRQFENLCYDLLFDFSYFDLKWLQGSSDRGRDIEANVIIDYPLIGEKSESYHFECKRYTNGIGTDVISGKINWANIHKPDKLIFLVSSHLTPSAKDFIEQGKKWNYPNVEYMEGVDLKRLIIERPLIIEKYFLTHAKKMFLNLMDEFLSYSFTPDSKKLNYILEEKNLINELTTREKAFVLYCAIKGTIRADRWTELFTLVINEIENEKETSVLAEKDVKSALEVGRGACRGKGHVYLEGRTKEERKKLIDDMEDGSKKMFNYKKFNVYLNDGINMIYYQINKYEDGKILELLINEPINDFDIELSYINLGI